VLKLQEEFIKRFIEEEKYLQNPPLKLKDFIKFCEERGIKTNESELEFFEKEKLFYPIFRTENPIVEDEMLKFFKDKDEPHFRYLYPHFNDNEYYKNILLGLMKKGYLFDPSTKPFKEWSSFEDEELENGREKISSFYSSFQIHWLTILKESYSFNVNLAYNRIIVSSSLTRLNEFKLSDTFSIESFDDFQIELEKASGFILGELVFNFEKKKQELIKMYQYFRKIIEFLMSIEHIYAPYGRSSSKTINVRDKKWDEKREKFNPKRELNDFGVTIQEVASIYGIFSEKSRKILGIKRDDWIQLWKSIAWNRKDKLEGHNRLGIEYLQWASMLKRFIEDYCKREILDIDEMSNISRNDILKFDPPKMDQSGILLRASRNEKYFDPEKNKNYYHDKYKRLFYLANDFELNYQPKIMVFVEGETEEELFPKIFEWCYNKPENIGIEFMNFKGVDKLLSTSQNATELKNLIDKIQEELRKRCSSNTQRAKITELIKKLNKTDIIISNWTSFISYNLKKWQIIPFFVSDNEGNVKHFLDAGKPINFDGGNYDIPDRWKYLWGETNENKPYKGNNFEFANFSDDELLLAINQVLNDELDIKKIKEIRDQEEGIKKIDDRILRSQTKRKIVNILFDNLFKKYEETKDESLLDRPIFELIRKIVNLAHSNPPPVNTRIEVINKKYILDLLEGKLESEEFN